MSDLNNTPETTIYEQHIITQLLQEMIEDMNIGKTLQKSLNLKRKSKYKNTFYEDTIYIESISKLGKQGINYFLKNLEIIFCIEKHTVIDLKYDYYDKNETIANTEIKFNFI